MVTLLLSWLRPSKIAVRQASPLLFRSAQRGQPETVNRQRATGKRQKLISKSNAKVKNRNICCSFFKSNAKGSWVRVYSQRLESLAQPSLAKAIAKSKTPV
jgi:hypothetical protein